MPAEAAAAQRDHAIRPGGAATPLDLAVALPEEAHDACVQRLLELLAGRPGIEAVHLEEAAGQARLCIHHDPVVLPLSRIREVVASAGAEISARYGHLLAEVRGVRHERHVRTASARLRALPGVLEAEISPSGRLRVEYDRNLTSESALQGSLAGSGLALAAAPPAAEAHAHEGDEHGSDAWELRAAIAAGVATGAGWIAEAMGAPPPVLGVLWAAAYVLGGWFPLQDVWGAIRARRLDIELLMLLAAAGAAVLGEWFEGALLLFLFSLGHSLEHYAMGRARRAVEALGKLAPETATVLVDGRQVERPVGALVAGDRVLVKPGERVPADGWVLAGTSAVDQAPITGESVPVDKAPLPAGAPAELDRMDALHRLFAGTINGSGSLEMQVARAASDTTLARVLRTIAEAETSGSPTQRFTDRFERVFVPAVLLLALGVVGVGVLLGQPVADSTYRAMAVLVAASPCALAIATPSAVLSAVARAAREGVLVKGGAALEELGAVRSIAFDKTGTLTEGKPEVVDIVPVDAKEADLLSVAAAVERQSSHPLAAAVVRRAEKAGVPVLAASEVENVVAAGMRGRVDGALATMGKLEMFADPPEPVRARVDELRQRGRTIVVVQHGQRWLGVLGLMDRPRPAALDTLRALRETQVERMVLLSGDHQAVAAAVAKELGLDEGQGGLLPEQKVEAIDRLRASGGVAMVGDGVNDGPALARANVGIAMGAAGSDVALETADVALMGDDLAKLPFALGLGHSARAVIRQNLWMSLGMVAFLIPATLSGLAGVGPAVVLHEGSTLLVVANALRLLAWRPADRPSTG